MTDWKSRGRASPRRQIEFDVDLGLAGVVEHLDAECCLAVEPGRNCGPVLGYLNLVQAGRHAPVRLAVDLVLTAPSARVGRADGGLDRPAHTCFGHERDRRLRER